MPPSLADNKTTAVVVQVTNSATAGQLTNTQTTSALATAVSLQVAGASGTTQLSFAAGTKLSAVANAFNNIKSVTGVSAHNSGATLKLDSTGFGSSQFVSVSATSGTFTTGWRKRWKKLPEPMQPSRLTVQAATASGKNVTYRDNNLDVSFTLSSALNGGKSKTFGVTGGGANLCLR